MTENNQSATRATLWRVLHFGMLATALLAAAGVIAALAVKYDQMVIRRQLTADIAALEARVQAAELRANKLWARQDRLQAVVSDRGWRDSMMLTQINWKKPDPF